MNESSYHILRRILGLFLWDKPLVGKENLPERGPAVFIGNHLASTGPIACICSLPFRLHPWSIGDMMDPEKAPVYLNKDFMEGELHLKPPLSIWLSRHLTRFTVPMFRSLGCIPVHKGDYARMQETLQLSLQILCQGESVLVFPEDPALDANEVSGMKPFQHTFSRLGEMYHSRTGQCLAFYPLAVHPSGMIRAGKPVWFNPFNPPGQERQRIKDILEKRVVDMYLGMEGEPEEEGIPESGYQY